MSGTTGLPKSFEERGLLIGFFKPSLRHARLRARPSDGLIEWEIMIPVNRDKRNAAMMIMPWRQLNAYTQLYDRDLSLYKVIDDLDVDDPDPLDLRRVRLNVDAILHPDLEGKLEAKHQINRDRRDRLNVYISLLAQMTRDAGIALGDTFMARADTQMLMRITQGDENLGISGEALTNRVLGFHAQKLGQTTKDVNTKLERVTDLVAAFGSLNVAEASQREGLFHALRARLDDFDRGLNAFELEATSEVQNMAVMVRFAAKDFIRLVEDKTSTVEQILSNVATVLTETDRVAQVVAKARREVAFALDGWDLLIEHWRKLPEDAGYEAKVDALTYIFQYLPMMPEEALEALKDGGKNRGKVWKGFNFARAGVVRAMVSWGDNQVDQELIDRINRAKEAERQQREAAERMRGRRRR